MRVITGRDKGKEGRVLRVIPREGKVLVEHVMMVKKNVRPNPQKNIKGGIAEQESADLHQQRDLVCNSCKRPVRVGHEHARRPPRAGMQELREYAGKIVASL